MFKVIETLFYVAGALLFTAQVTSIITLANHVRRPEVDPAARGGWAGHLTRDAARGSAMSSEIAATASIEGATTSASLASRLRSPITALTAFLTLVDLFATQAILPSLTRAYQVPPAAMVSPSTRVRWEWQLRALPSPFSASNSTDGEALSSA